MSKGDSSIGSKIAGLVKIEASFAAVGEARKNWAVLSSLAWYVRIVLKRSSYCGVEAPVGRYTLDRKGNSMS
jgi:hypothetical protein